MSFLKRSQKLLTALAFTLVLVLTTSCAAPNQTSQSNVPTASNSGASYAQLERGNTGAGQEFGGWVVQTARGLVSDAYVRDNNKLGVVITPQVRPNEVQPLAKSLVQGFRQNFPNRDLTVLMYAPDKQLILTARYDTQSNQVTYQ
ncbi:MAG TPA: hypothetical protein DDZ80_32725 [Cyanobacteria bacterium UBA8803]|nr:hypothetical protein [Cyanobacteria bacterium UBA9273]HBL62964.1 hypothetical protein [Cyanobacteria bacterium UBA8803]